MVNNLRNSKKESVRKEILIYMLAGGYILVGLSHPYLLAPAILLAQFEKRGVKRKNIQNAFYYARDSGLVAVRSGKYALTKRGVQKARLLALSQMKNNKPEKWDKKWRIIVFDIPQKNRAKRDALRTLIKNMGCVQLQKSTWLYPYKLDEEINFLKKCFSFSKKELRIITAESIGDDGEFRKKFNVKK